MVFAARKRLAIRLPYNSAAITANRIMAVSISTVSSSSSSTTSSSSSSSSSTSSSSTSTPRRLSHHTSDGKFTNPASWGSYVDHGPLDFFLKALPEWRRDTKYYALPVKTPDWEKISNASTTHNEVTTTHLGHACYFLQTGGFNVLTDPVFSYRASPVRFAGPARFTPPACTVEDFTSNSIPIHAVVISHSHYDHLDQATITKLLEHEKKLLAFSTSASSSSSSNSNSSTALPYTGTTYFCPLGIADILRYMGVTRPGAIVELDWWQSHDLVVSSKKTSSSIAPSSTSSFLSNNQKDTESVSLKLTCVPAQHQSGRTIFDRNKTLWCGWVGEASVIGGILSSSSSSSSSSSTNHPKLTANNSSCNLPPTILSNWYFSGDTGYRSVDKAGAEPYSAGEEAATRCPIFKQIGNAYGPFDLCLLPIGAYSPRSFMSSFHTSPEDAVEMHVELKSKKSVGIHWGAFPLTDEPIEEPLHRLVEAVKRKGLNVDEFVAIGHGEVLLASSSHA